MTRRLFSSPRKQAWVFVLVLVLLLGVVPLSRAQSDAVYFPQSGHFVRGSFLNFWRTWEPDQSKPWIFGYPITEEYTGSNGRITQYFERARFELNEQGQVELGKLGLDATVGRGFAPATPILDTAQRRYMPNVASTPGLSHYSNYPYIIQYGFKEIWETRGGERIFGMPISNELDETINGSLRTVQYFERVRFEFWPEHEPGKRVVISDLGRRSAPPERMVWLGPNDTPGTQPTTRSQTQPTTQPTAQPTATPSVPAAINARIAPEVGAPGTEFGFVAVGFQKSEKVSMWLTSPGPQSRQFALEREVKADSNGSIQSANVTFKPSKYIGDAPDFEIEGVWAISAQGKTSGRKAVAYFRVSRTSTSTTTTPATTATTAPAATATPIPAATGTPVASGSVPAPTGACATNAPDPAAGFQAWLTNTNPNVDDSIRLCMRLIYNNQIVTDATGEGLVNLPDKEWLGPEKPNTTDGIVSLKFRVTNDNDNQAVAVDAQMTASGQVYQTRITFQVPKSAYDNNGDGKVNCDDFDKQTEAQKAYEAGYERLDGDGDGKACEDLP